MAATASTSAPKKSARRVSATARSRHAILPPAPVPPSPYRFTVQDYYHLGEMGVFREGERVELIQGEIVMMPPIDPGHAEGTDNSQCEAQLQLRDHFKVRCQQPVRLSPTSEPVPDVSIVKLKSYKQAHPKPDDILLIIEVANSSLSFDLGHKKLMYAAAAIPEYWVLDLPNRLLHVFTRPRRGDYSAQRTLAADEKVQSATLKPLKLKVADLLP